MTHFIQDINTRGIPEMIKYEILTADEVATMLRIDRQRVYSLTRQNLLPHIKIGYRGYRYSLIEIQKWLENGGNLANDIVDVQVKDSIA
jgi:excisionase family DNA binding protein